MWFWKSLWEKPTRAYAIGLASWTIGMLIFLAILREMIDAGDGAAVVNFAAGCFAVWSLMFSLGAMATCANVMGRSYEERFRALEDSLIPSSEGES